MRLKSELYKKEQEEIVDKIIGILDLENRPILNVQGCKTALDAKGPSSINVPVKLYLFG